MERDAWDRRYATSEMVWTAQPNRFVVEELRDLPPGRALDLGAGEGRNAVWLAERGWKVRAVDFSPVGLDKGRQLAAARGVTVDWSEADLRDHQPEPAAYDLVLVSYLHLQPADLAAVLRRAAAAVAPGGTILVVGHDVTNITDGVGGPQSPEVLYTPERVTTELTGLTVHRAERVHRLVEAGGAAVDTLVRATRD